MRRGLHNLCYTSAATVLALLTWAPAGAAAEQAANPLATAQQILVQLDELRAVSADDPARVVELLTRGTDAIARAKQQVAENAPSEPAAKDRLNPSERAAAIAKQQTALCQIAFVQAELHRRAAMALPTSDQRRAKEFQAALDGYKSLRLDYRALAVGRLGYAGEARVHRAMGDLAKADQAVVDVTMTLDDRRTERLSPEVAQVQRALWLERVKTAYGKSVAEGGTLANRLKNSQLMKTASAGEQAVLEWASLDAEIDANLKDGNGDAARLASRVRDETFVRAVPEYERLAALMKLHDARKVEVLPQELLRGARLQAWAGLGEQAVATYGAAAAKAPDQLTNRDWESYGTMLYRLGHAASAADAMDRCWRVCRRDRRSIWPSCARLRMRGWPLARAKCRCGESQGCHRCVLATGR